MKTLAIIGIGNRGSEYLGLIKLFYGRKIKLVALCDNNPEKLKRFGKQYKIPDEMRFLSHEEFLSKGVIADGLIIATPDREHYRMAKAALLTGYKTILLEKPLSGNIEESRELNAITKEQNAKWWFATFCAIPITTLKSSAPLKAVSLVGSYPSSKEKTSDTSILLIATLEESGTLRQIHRPRYLQSVATTLT